MWVIKWLWNLFHLRGSSAELFKSIVTSGTYLLCHRPFSASQKVVLDSDTLGILSSQPSRRTNMMNWLLSCFPVTTGTSYHLKFYTVILLYETISFIILSQLGLLGMKYVIDSGEWASHWEVWKHGGTPATLFKGFLFISATKACGKY